MVNRAEIFDVTIIGAGPVGLYALYYAGLRDARAKIIEALDEIGGGLKILYPEKYIYDVAGYPQILANDLVAQFEEQARTYDAHIVLGQRVININRRDDEIIELKTTSEIHYSKTAIICTGLGAFIPKKIDIPNLEKLEGAGVYYYVKDTSLFKDKRILIVGGGDSAVENAIMLYPDAREVNLIHRNDRLRAHEESVKQLQNSPVKLYYPFWEVKELFGEDWIEGVTAVNSYSGEEIHFEVDALILNLGFLTNLKPLKQWGLELQYNAIKVDEIMRTNIPEIYAAGDIVHHSGKLKLISTGTGEAAIAVNNAVNFVDPRKSVEPGHSSHIKRPDGK